MNNKKSYMNKKGRKTEVKIVMELSWKELIHRSKSISVCPGNGANMMSSHCDQGLRGRRKFVGPVNSLIHNF